MTPTTPTLNGKRVVLLGGTAGIGRATAHAAAQEGASIVVSQASNPASIKRYVNSRPEPQATPSISRTNPRCAPSSKV